MVDDYALIRDGVAAMISSKDIVVGSVSNGEVAINQASKLSPYIIIMDIVLKGMSGIEATRWIKEQIRTPASYCLLSIEVKKEFVSLGIQSGISGYLHKDVPKETLLDAIRTVHAGCNFLQ